MIKISDLSVGDWVRFRGKEWQVCSIYKFTEEVGLFRKDSQICENLSELETIPITAEILEANGFNRPDKKVWGDTWDWTNKKDTMVELSVYKDNYYMRVVQLINGIQQDGVCGIALHYVHELQKILRLAGVDKEINL